MNEPQRSKRGPCEGPAKHGRAAKIERRPWVTWGMIAACLIVFVGLAREPKPHTWDALSQWGAPPADRVWEGAYWGLLSSALVHEELWHLAFNVYWLWALGMRVERALGSVRYLLLIVSAAVVSSGCQLGASETMGIGASGVGYALFGFMWVARPRFPAFRDVLSPQTIQLFLFWLVGCMVATYADIVHVGNAAHLSGMLFGATAGGLLAVKSRRRLLSACLVGLVAASLTPLFWCPWSATWLGLQAYRAHEAGNHAQAIDYYTGVVHRDGQAAWAYYNRGIAYLADGNREAAALDFTTASKLDPTLENPLPTGAARNGRQMHSAGQVRER